MISGIYFDFAPIIAFQKARSGQFSGILGSAGNRLLAVVFPKGKLETNKNSILQIFHNVGLSKPIFRQKSPVLQMR